MLADPKQAAQALRVAEKYIAHALEALDEDRTACETCGLQRYDEHEEHLMAEALRGALGRCERVRSQIEREKGGA